MRLLVLAALALTTIAVGDCTCGGEPPDERTSCEVQADCTGEESCIDVPSGRVCAVFCDANTPCPEGSACVNDGDQLTCRSLLDNLELGRLCTMDRQCQSGACVGPDEFGDFFCAAQCQVNDDCPDEEFCFLADHRRVCLTPLFPQLGAGAACARGPRECESRACVRVHEADVAGVCSDQCEPAAGCTGERNCVHLESGGDACVDYAPDGAACDSALVCEHLRCVTDDDDSQLCSGSCTTDADCALADWVCVPAAVGDDVCMPIRPDAGAAGEACGSRRDCLSGYCAGFDDGVTNHGLLCADPCDADGACTDTALVCWELDPPTPDLCGPFPTQP